MDFETLKQRDGKYVANNNSRFDVAIEKGVGATLYDFEGKEYIDFASGIGVNSFGVCDPVWKKAVAAQMNRVQHTSNYFYNEPQGKLAMMLSKRTGCKKVFFSNSGAEANECAIKCARKYSFDKYGEGRYEIITLNESFHGRTMATVTATGQDEFHKFFNPFLEGFKYVDANKIDDFTAAVSKSTCAVMIELIQGESGVINLEEDYVSEVARICKKKDILLIVDEVQTGNGRTGNLYAYMYYEISPDIVTTAKGLAGGLPLGATMFFNKTENVLTPGTHGTTFGGNPLAVAGAISIIKRLDDKFLDEVEAKSKYMASRIIKMKNVKALSGMGLMFGIETDLDSKAVVKNLIAKGLITLTAKKKVRLLPPLNITKAEMDKGLAILAEELNK